MELGQGRVRLGVRERFCTQRAVGHWDRLLRVTAPSLLEFKKCLDKVLRHRVGVLGGPLCSQELDSVVLVYLFQPRVFGDSVTSVAEVLTDISATESMIIVRSLKSRTVLNYFLCYLGAEVTFFRLKLEF